MACKFRIYWQRSEFLKLDTLLPRRSEAAIVISLDRAENSSSKGRSGRIRTRKDTILNVEFSADKLKSKLATA